MHILRPQFRIPDQQALAFAAERGFGVVVASDERGPRGSHVPFVLTERDGHVVVQLHLTAQNPLVPLADGVRRFLLIVSGDDAYISNDWYASRDNVSTWLYEAVHFSGIAHLRDRDENRGHGDALLAISEARLRKQPWELTQMEPAKRETMLSSIRVIDLVVDQIEGQSKLNHHKSDEDHVAVANQLARAEETGSQRLAEKMWALRPGLDYDAATRLNGHSRELSMQQDAFEAGLRSDGYVEIETKALDPRPQNEGHAHDYDIRGLVLDGIFIVKQDDQPVTYRAGEVFAVSAGRRHTEEIGPQGVRILVGRKY
jgi:transcriptional regulator